MSCTIIIFHYESLAYLRGCIGQIRRYKREDIPYKIIIADQSPNEDYIKTIYAEFGSDEDISIVRLSPFGSGHSVDFVVMNSKIDTDYICTIDVDTIPIHKNWLYAPIKLIEETNMAWVGVHAQIEGAYAHMGNFFCMCQHFRVAKTETYKDLVVNAGFVKNDFRKRLSLGNTEWTGWSDDGVIAHWWEDKYRNNSKFTLAVTKYLGIAPMEGRYGRYTDDLVFHFGFSYNWKMVKNSLTSMGDEFIQWMRRMDEEGLSAAMIDEIINKLIPLEAPIPRICWDGDNKKIYTPSEELNKLFNKLKEE